MPHLVIFLLEKMFIFAFIYFNMTALQEKIIKTLLEQPMSCSDIAWKLKMNQIHIGVSIKSLIKMDLVSGQYKNGQNPVYFPTGKADKLFK